jgi:RecA/RadA recombinase
LIGGGLPRGGITELIGAHSCGRTTLACAIVAGLTTAGHTIAWLDLPDAFHPEQASAAGVDLRRILWVRPPDLRAALRAAEHVLRAGGFDLVVLDLHAASASASDHYRDATWLRLARAAERSRSTVLIIAAQRIVGVFGTLCIEHRRRTAHFSGAADPCRVFEGMGIALDVRKNRFGPPGTLGECLFASGLG